MKDGLVELRFYKMALDLWDLCWNDTEIMKNDFRGKEIAKQLIRSCGSISANIEEGYGRGFGKEYPHFLRIARGSARESKGWYQRTKFLLTEDIINERCIVLDSLIAMITKSIETLENKRKSGTKDEMKD
jgi:four helix bundle protein